MQTSRFFLTVFVSLSLSMGCSGPKKLPSSPGMKMVWSDEFNYKGLPDKTKWNYEVGGNGWGNNELQYYTADRLENARVEDGHLVIEARKEPWQGKKYTSARLVTKGKGDWTYGRIEVRAKLPKGLGSWPAIWMLGSVTPLKWPDDGEIDIMEHVGYDQGKIHGSIHTKDYNHIMNTQKTAIIDIPDCSEKYHVYALDWTADTIKISVDDRSYFAFGNVHKGKGTWPFDAPCYLLLNVAVGGNWGGQKGVDDNALPMKMEVDYVRVYQSGDKR
jgi:beta-glucanase (GH16 family)